MLNLCLGLQDSRVLQRAIVYALRPHMQALSGAGSTAPQACRGPEAWTPQHLRLILPLLMLLGTRTQYMPSDSDHK